VRPGNNGIVSIDPVRKRRSEPGRLQYACGSNGAMCIVLRGKCTCAHVRMYGTARIVAVLKAKCIARLHVCTYVRTACTSFTRREPERAVRIHALMYRIARTVRSRSTYVLHVRTYVRTYRTAQYASTAHAARGHNAASVMYVYALHVRNVRAQYRTGKCVYVLHARNRQPHVTSRTHVPHHLYVRASTAVSARQYFGEVLECVSIARISIAHCIARIAVPYRARTSRLYCIKLHRTDANAQTLLHVHAL
jgi:hypothetical protein